MRSDVKYVLRMKEGFDETSYAKTSYIQKEVLLLTKSIKEKAIKELYYKEQPSTICIADLGCSSAELNNLSVVYELIHSVEEARRKLGSRPHQDYQVYLNDLPGNDFNTIFRSLHSFEDNLKLKMGDSFGHCFVHAAPGSFYGRLFPDNHLHFVHSSYSLMWLSQVPKGIEDNQRNIYIGRTSPPHVLRSYYNQFESDFLTFLKCRSKEVIVGGMMVLTILGRKEDKQYSKESCYEWELLAAALNDMVFEGLIGEEQLNTFNIPQYTPSAAELSFIVEKEGSFALNHAHVSEVSWEANEHHQKNSHSKVFTYYDFVKCMRSVAEPLLISHFGDAIIEELFQRYMEIVRLSMAVEKNVFINVTVSLTRKG